MEGLAREGQLQVEHQRPSFLLEARAREFWVVAKRKLERKQMLAGNEEQPPNRGLVTAQRPEARAN